MLKILTFFALLLSTIVTPAAQEPAPSPSPEKFKVTGDENRNPDSAQDLDKKLIAAGVLKGKAIKLPTPLYPAKARLACAEGQVSVEVIINEEGRVISTRAVSGDNLLREAAETAAMGAVFIPTTLKGVPVKVSGIINYNFVADHCPPISRPTMSELVSPEDKDKVWAFGAMISVIRSGDPEAIEQFSDGMGVEAFLKDIAADMPVQISSLKPLFLKLATAKPGERPAIASKLYGEVVAYLNTEQKWQAEIGLHLGVLVIEMMQFTGTGSTNPANIESELRSMKALLTAVPPDAPPQLVLRFRGIASYADTPGMSKPANLRLLWSAIEPLFEEEREIKKD